MTATVTDNGSNFIKAFQMFKADLGAQEEEGEDNEMEESEVNFIDLLAARQYRHRDRKPTICPPSTS